MRQPTNLPREALMQLAEETIKRFGGFPRALVHFKFTCAHCGERVMIDHANDLPWQAECCACHQITTITEGGFALEIRPD